MPEHGSPLQRLGFLTIGSFDPASPAGGHEHTLRVIERGEQLGLDSAWLRHRHLQPGISSPVAIMAAASQRTSRIELGTAVTPIGAENPFRLAEDLGTVDVLLGGRLNPGFSTGTPMNFDLYRDAIYPDTLDQEDLGPDRLLRLRDLVRGDVVSASPGRRGIEEFSDVVQPHSPGLVDRLWCGVGSTRSAVWAGEHGFHLLASSVTKAEQGTDFAVNQRAQIDASRWNPCSPAQTADRVLPTPHQSRSARPGLCGWTTSLNSSMPRRPGELLTTSPRTRSRRRRRRSGPRSSWSRVSG
jgi:alkanesulfonate monooxygenase SsuD/methylene tetrahydromethanopterin reductase-like flavin-dependent oxidoreductase (luciferase family)